MAIVFIALVNMAVISDSIVSDESITFVLFKLKLRDIILSQHQRDAMGTILNPRDVVVCLPISRSVRRVAVASAPAHQCCFRPAVMSFVCYFTPYTLLYVKLIAMYARLSLRFPPPPPPDVCSRDGLAS